MNDILEKPAFHTYVANDEGKLVKSVLPDTVKDAEEAKKAAKDVTYKGTFQSSTDKLTLGDAEGLFEVHLRENGEVHRFLQIAGPTAKLQPKLAVKKEDDKSAEKAPAPAPKRK